MNIHLFMILTKICSLHKITILSYYIEVSGDPIYDLAFKWNQEHLWMNHWIVCIGWIFFWLYNIEIVSWTKSHLLHFILMIFLDLTCNNSFFRLRWRCWEKRNFVLVGSKWRETTIAFDTSILFKYPQNQSYITPNNCYHHLIRPETPASMSRKHS